MVNRRVSVTLDADPSPFNRGVLSAENSTRRWVRELESADGRMAALVQGGLALVPALAPIGASAVPAIAGLTNQLGFAVVGAGTALLAFQGVGDAIEALGEFQAAPTAKNLEKLNEKLDALGPAGEVFVHQIGEIRDELQGLQDVAQQNMLPGVTEGIDSALTQLPRFEGVIESVAGALGRLAADAGASLASPEWSEFFEYLDNEAAGTLEATGKALGNLVEGVTNLVMALDPLSDDWTEGLLGASEDFVAWSDALDSTEGYQNFVEYVRESGPQVLDTFGSIAGAMIEFAEAAAPVGAVVLPVLEGMADGLAEIADSPAGPIIVGAAAAVGTLGRSLALLKAVGLRGGGDSLMGRVLDVDKIKAGVKAMQMGQQSLYNITTASERAEMSATGLAAARERQVVAEKARTAAMKAGAVQFGKSATAVGGLALMTSGVADSFGLANSTSLAMMGTLAGPWGAAVGGGVGLLLDMKSAADQATASVDDLVTPESIQDLVGLQERLTAGRTAIEDLNNTDFSSIRDIGQQIAFSFKDTFGGDNTAEMDAEVAKVKERADSIRDAYTEVAMALGEDFTDMAGRSMVPTLDQLTAAAERAQPAMEALGLSAEDLATMSPDELENTSDAIADWTTTADSAEGRTQAVATAFRGLDSDLIDTAMSADTVKESLEALLGPGMNLSAATDAWRDGLRNLNDELDKNKGSLFDNTDAASQNRSVIRDMVSTSVDLLTAQAGAGTGAKQLAKNLRTQRGALLDAGEAAGVSRKEMNKYLTTLGLTPKMISTLVKAETAEAMANINGFKFRWDQLKSKTIYLTTVETRTGAGGQGNGYDPSAFGNVFPTVQSFAWGGDIPNGHMPELAGPGITRVWREPETQGEAYIPLANDHRRPRARSILEDTAGRLGGSVEWYAGGGVNESPEVKKERERREEAKRREEERRQRQLDAQRAKDLLASDLRDEREQQRLELKDAKRRLESAREANRPKSEIRDAQLAVRQEKADRDDERDRRREEREQAAADARQEESERLQKVYEDMLAGQEKATQEWISAAEEQKASWQSIADDFKSKMDAIGAAATSPFQSDLFGDSNPWGDGGDWEATLDKDIAGLEERDKLIAQLGEAGLDPRTIQTLFDQGATNEDIKRLIASGRLDDLNAKIIRRAELTDIVSDNAGQIAYGPQYDAAIAQVQTFTDQLVVLNDALAAINALQNPTSAAAAQGYALQGQVLAGALQTAIVNGFNTVARRGS